MIDDFEAGFFARREVVDAADVHEEIEGHLRILLEKSENVMTSVLTEEDGEISLILMRGKDLRSESFLQFLENHRGGNS
jgi:hypothetical protein